MVTGNLKAPSRAPAISAESGLRKNREPVSVLELAA